MIKLTLYTCDWKEDPDIDEIRRLQIAVGGKAYLYQINQNDVDAEVYAICSDKVYITDLDEIWRIGDLEAEDYIWEGEDMKDILEQIKVYREGPK